MATLVRQLMQRQQQDSEIELSCVVTAPPPGRGRIVKLLFFLRAAAAVMRSCCRRPAPILHAHTACRGSLLRKSLLIRLGKLLGARTVMHFNGAILDNWYQSSSPGQQCRIRRQLSTPDVIIAVSDHWRECLATLTSVPIMTVSNAVDISDFAPSRERPGTLTVTMLFLGVVGRRKGAFELLRALRRALDHPSAPDLRLVLAGNGELEEARALVRELDLAGRVEIPGWIRTEEKLRRLQEADVFVLPTHHEGLPLALIEAMAAGLPLISTRASGIPDVVEDGKTGLLITPGNVSDLSEAIVRLAADPEMRRRMGEAALKRAGDFDVGGACSEIKEIYLRLAGGD
jgi:glycosyltransferase involved in cell wall biosynthesis